MTRKDKSRLQVLIEGGSIRTSMKLTELEDAFKSYRRALAAGFKCRLVVSFHEYSEGIYLEFNKTRINKGTDFVIQSSL